MDQLLESAMLVLIITLLNLTFSQGQVTNHLANNLPGVVVFASPKTSLISHQLANRAVAERRQLGQLEFPIRLRKVKVCEKLEKL